jgi:spermidine synthase
VEIDPVVHDFATKYFGLPENHTAFINDAVVYASSAVASGQTFDYIVHDVFTGGAEPVDLFTFEFLNDLQSLLKPNGAIAIVSKSAHRDRYLANSRRTTLVI